MREGARMDAEKLVYKFLSALRERQWLSTRTFGGGDHGYILNMG